jgi:hypothetical protein
VRLRRIGNYQHVIAKHALAHQQSFLHDFFGVFFQRPHIIAQTLRNFADTPKHLLAIQFQNQKSDERKSKTGQNKSRGRLGFHNFLYRLIVSKQSLPGLGTLFFYNLIIYLKKQSAMKTKEKTQLRKAKKSAVKKNIAEKNGKTSKVGSLKYILEGVEELQKSNFKYGN